MKGQYFSICSELLKLPHFSIMPCRKRKQCYLYLVILVNRGTLFWSSELPATSGRWQKKTPVKLSTICLAKTASQPWGDPETPPVSPWGTPGVYLRLLPFGPGTPPGWHQWGLGGDPRGAPGWCWRGLGVTWVWNHVAGWHRWGHGVTAGITGWPWVYPGVTPGDQGVAMGWQQEGPRVTPGWHRRGLGLNTGCPQWCHSVTLGGSHGDTRGVFRVTPGWQQGYLGLTSVGSWDDTRTTPAGGSWGDPGVTPQQWLGTYSHQNLIHMNLNYVSQVKHFVGLTSLCGK